MQLSAEKIQLLGGKEREREPFNRQKEDVCEPQLFLREDNEKHPINYHWSVFFLLGPDNKRFKFEKLKKSKEEETNIPDTLGPIDSGKTFQISD